MNSNTLIADFFHALGWNAFAYGAYKLCYLILSYALYVTLDEQAFALWAALMSYIFFWLLMLDCGFRKSVPRFCPDFSYDKKTHRKFVGLLCIAQSALLVSALPFFYWSLPYFFKQVSAAIGRSDGTLVLLATLLFFAQGCLALMRIIYHAHFWNKQFNSLATVVIAIECIASLLLCLVSIDQTLLMRNLLIINVLGALSVAVMSLVALVSMRYVLVAKEAESMEAPTKQFVVHTLFMWASNSIKALSERNFLLPYVLYSLGPTMGIAFKLNNDAALFFYRLAVKTVGINDTALLSYARHTRGGTRAVFVSLVRTTVCIVVPLLCIALVGVVLVQHYLPAKMMAAPFCLFIVGYMIEFLLSPYERILEVSLRYRLLSIAYMPYLIILLSMFYHDSIKAMGLFSFIATLQGLRVMSALIMVYYARRVHNA